MSEDRRRREEEGVCLGLPESIRASKPLLMFHSSFHSLSYLFISCLALRRLQLTLPNKKRWQTNCCLSDSSIFIYLESKWPLSRLGEKKHSHSNCYLTLMSFWHSLIWHRDEPLYIQRQKKHQILVVSGQKKSYTLEGPPVAWLTVCLPDKWSMTPQCLKQLIPCCLLTDRCHG